MPSACCTTWGRMTVLLWPRCSTSLPSLAWSLRLLTACWSALQANCWMKQKEGEFNWKELIVFFVPIVNFICAYSHDSPLFDFIEGCLRNKNEMVVYEAASAIVHMPNCTARELAPAVSGYYLTLISFLKASFSPRLTPVRNFNMFPFLSEVCRSDHNLFVFLQCCSSSAALLKPPWGTLLSGLSTRYFICF